MHSLPRAEKQGIITRIRIFYSTTKSLNREVIDLFTSITDKTYKAQCQLLTDTTSLHLTLSTYQLFTTT